MRAAWIALGLLTLVCAARTYARNLDWLDDLSLWTSAVDVCPESAKAHNNLGRPWQNYPAGCRTRLSSTRRRCALNPTTPSALQPGDALSQRPAGCRKLLPGIKRHCGSTPITPRRHNNLGFALANSGGRWQEAIVQFQAAAAAQSRSGRGARQSGTRAGQFRRHLQEARCRVSSGAKDRSRVRRGPQQLGTRAGQFRRALAGGRCPVSSGAADRSRSRRGAREPGERAFPPARPGCRTPSPSTRRRCGFNPAMRTRTTTWDSRSPTPGVGRRPSPSTKRHCASIPILPRRTSTWETRSPSSPAVAGCHRSV